MTPWLITGAGGMAGIDLRDELLAQDIEFTALTRSDLDITSGRSVAETVREARPRVIVNCAAFTRVDDAEAEERVANAVNGSAVELLASAANEAGALLIQISTDFVFDGSKRTPYEINDPTGPLSAYGRSKLLGEIAATHANEHLIVRSSWLFGAHGRNFVEAIRNQIRKGTDPLRVVDDQRGRPTYTPHLARAIIRLAQHAEARGIVHYADEPECTWYDFARAIVEETGAGNEVKPVSTSDFPRPAPRPAYSVLSTERYERLTGVKPDSWREGLREYLERSP
ncbi:MAG TPA: dTDP-4-dehydrorhamnose reductase [Thermoanaerobaculia bacterium]|nr:dTDP-4-dehydrorhamnose reductase [Thermoanaerobaculia bacterium]